MSIRYLPELDGLRALAAIAVVAFHVRLPGLYGGFLGVDVFFVLSGYLTASLALSKRDRSGGRAFADFMARRVRRLWPLLLCVSGAVAAFLLAAGAPVAIDVLPGALFLGNVSAMILGPSGLMVHTWTLGAEMQFYAAVALLAFVAPAAPIFRAIAASAFLAITAARLGYAHSEDWRTGFYSPFSHSSGLFLGAILATLPLDRLRHAGAILVASIVTLTAAFVLAEFQSAAALAAWITLAEIATAGMVASIVSGPGAAGAFMRAKPLRKLGIWAFGIYLWHYPIAYVARAHVEPLPAFALTLCLAVLLAAATYRFVEEPMRAARRYPRAAPSLGA